jgi:hypothetical protein
MGEKMQRQSNSSDAIKCDICVGCGVIAQDGAAVRAEADAT